MGEMKGLVKTNSKIEAQMICNYLQANHIEALLNGSRDYASIITGTDIGAYEVSVDDEHYLQAHQLLAELNRSDAQKEPATVGEVNPRDYYKKALFLVIFASFILPVVSNILSLSPFMKFMKGEKESSSKNLSIFIYLLLNLLQLAFYFWFYFRIFKG